MKIKIAAGIVSGQRMAMEEMKGDVQEVVIENDRFKEADTKRANIGKKGESWGDQLIVEYDTEMSAMTNDMTEVRAQGEKDETAQQSDPGVFHRLPKEIDDRKMPIRQSLQRAQKTDPDHRATTTDWKGHLHCSSGL